MDIKDILKTYFKKHAFPTEAQYAELIDSFVTSDEFATALQEYVKKNEENSISETITLTGSKKLFFKQGSSSDKPGFTVYNADGSEAAYFEYKKTSNMASLAMGNYITGGTSKYTETQIGFKISDAGNNIHYAVFMPKAGDAKAENDNLSTEINTPTIFRIPLRFKVGDNYITASEGGTVDLTEVLQTLLQNGNN